MKIFNIQTVLSYKKLFLNFTNFYETTECNQFAKRKLRYFVDSTNFMMTLKMIMASRIKILFYC
ncbi:hypothetical protein T03_13651 [Trichinella britovi]|uniref:Uncharacterized protein n=1 Tax=Trichinella britovi TaxID=45882 RepID=A0A0V1CE74_TRIBR|nr:hypothetical protein T03_13651 [Trichinella britovi]KRZ86743.1 hypothetical protein T08_4672 [Trichinella sp. T8]